MDELVSYADLRRKIAGGDVVLLDGGIGTEPADLD